MERDSKERDQRVQQVLDDEYPVLRERYLELLSTGTTTLREPNGTWKATLGRPRRKARWLATEGTRSNGHCAGTAGVSGQNDDHLEFDVMRWLAEGVIWLRER